MQRKVLLGSFFCFVALSSAALPAAYPLHHAAQTGNVKRLHELLEHDPASINAGDEDNWTLLHSAAANGRFACIKLLLQRGAHVNAQDRSGLTPLHSAARYGYITNVQELLNSGADFEAKTNKGKTAKNFAQKNRHTAIVDLLKNYENGLGGQETEEK